MSVLNPPAGYRKLTTRHWNSGAVRVHIENIRDARVGNYGRQLSPDLVNCGHGDAKISHLHVLSATRIRGSSVRWSVAVCDEQHVVTR